MAVRSNDNHEHKVRLTEEQRAQLNEIIATNTEEILFQMASILLRSDEVKYPGIFTSQEISNELIIKVGIVDLVLKVYTKHGFEACLNPFYFPR